MCAWVGGGCVGVCVCGQLGVGMGVYCCSSLTQIRVSPDARNTAWVGFDGRDREELRKGDRYLGLGRVPLWSGLLQGEDVKKARASGRNVGKVFNPVLKLLFENYPFSRVPLFSLRSL